MSNKTDQRRVTIYATVRVDVIIDSDSDISDDEIISDVDYVFSSNHPSYFIAGTEIVDQEIG